MGEAPLEGRRILVVENEYIIAEDLQVELEKMGATVVGPVPTVELGLALLATFDRVLDGAVLDIVLDEGKVFPVVDALMARGVPVVFATGLNETSIPVRYARIARFEKPFDIKKIARALAE